MSVPWNKSAYEYASELEDQVACLKRQLAAQRNEFQSILGSMAVRIPLPDVLKATGTVSDMVAYVQGLQARAEAAEAELKLWKERFAGR